MSRIGWLVIAWLATVAAAHAAQMEKPSSVPEVGLMPGVPFAPHKLDEGILIGVIDSGVRRDHPQIGNAVTAVKDFTGEGPEDFYGHGTRVVLVLIYGFYKGFPGLDVPKQPHPIAVAKVIGKTHASAQVVSDRMVAAIGWLASLKVGLVNISISLPDGAADYTRLCAAIVAQKDVMFSIAAGNSGLSSVVYPAACKAPNKMSVGASVGGKVEDYSGSSDVVIDLPPPMMDLAQYDYFQGVEAYRHQNYAMAQIAFESALQAHPGPALAGRLTYNLGVIALRRGDAVPAMMRFERTAELAPTFGDAYAALASMQSDAGNFAGAKAVLERGLAVGAVGANLRERLARVYMDLDQPREALIQLDLADTPEAKADDPNSLRGIARNMIKIEAAIAGGQSALAMALALEKAGAGELVRFVIHRWRPDLDAVPPGSATPLLVSAVADGKRAIARLLLDAGARVDGRDPVHNITALMVAATRGDEEMADELLRRGADFRLQDDFGFTPMTFAAEAGRPAIVKKLLDRGAETTVKSKEGLDALDYARKHNHADVAAMIAATRR